MSLLVGAGGLGDLMESGHGVLTDDAAVFGLAVPNRETPGWVFDGLAVAKVIMAKPVDDLPPTLWHDIARVLRQAVAGERAAWPLRGALLTRSAARCMALLDRLPKPPVPVPDQGIAPASAASASNSPAAVAPASASAPATPVRAGAGGQGRVPEGWWDVDLRAAVHRLADDLAEPTWVGGDVVAGHLDDLLRALTWNLAMELPVSA